jgi:hypothetical protein
VSGSESLPPPCCASPWHQGRDAAKLFILAKTVISNPYSVASRDYAAWRDGYSEVLTFHHRTHNTERHAPSGAR